MNVFIDHTPQRDHYYSLHALFEKRLKMNLYRPIGPGWRATGLQFCDFNDPGEFESEDGVYHVPMRMEPEAGFYAQNAITFDKFLKMDFDFLVTIYAAHEEPFYHLVKTYKPNAVFIRQVGNIHEKPQGFCKNILLANLTPMPSDVNCLIYYPENYEGYCYTPPSNHKTVKNFVHDLPYYPNDVTAFLQCEEILNDFTFKMHGRGGRDGEIPSMLMPQAMKDAAFVWHVKAHGGAGFVLRQALACGRPCIVNRRYMMTHDVCEQNLTEDSMNCIDLNLGRDRAIGLMKAWSQPDVHLEVCRRTEEKFQRDTNPAREAEKVGSWMSGLRRGVSG
jgi:hypothetical protein